MALLTSARSDGEGVAILKTIPSRDYDVAIIGSGPAGLTVAMKLADRLPLRIAVIESGSRGAMGRAQRLSAVSARGDLRGSYFSVHSQRCFGGTSTIWAGWCSMLEERAFSAGEWPIEYADHARYYPEAATMLEVDHTSHIEPIRALDGTEDLTYKPFYRTPAVKFNLKYGELLEQHDRIDVFLDKTVVELDHDAGRVRAARIRDSEAPEQPATTLEAETFVIACGGVGNPRLLLLSGIGSPPSVGGYFMCHPHLDISPRSPRIELDEEPIARVVTRRDEKIDHAIQLSTERAQRDGLVSIAVSFQIDRQVDSALLGRRRRVLASRTELATEMRPLAENRVYLGNDRDYLGQPNTRIDFTYGNEEEVARSWQAFTRELISSGLGRPSRAQYPFRFGHGGGHHLGATRMGRDPSRSVVDGDCRVHGMENLYVAGSSIFPASGVSNPTYAIVAFALRLADHLGDLRESA